MLILVILLVLIFGGGFGYYGNAHWGAMGGGGISIVGILLVLLVCRLLGLI